MVSSDMNDMNDQYDVLVLPSITSDVSDTLKFAFHRIYTDVLYVLWPYSTSYMIKVSEHDNSFPFKTARECVACVNLILSMILTRALYWCLQQWAVMGAKGNGANQEPRSSGIPENLQSCDSNPKTSHLQKSRSLCKGGTVSLKTPDLVSGFEDFMAAQCHCCITAYTVQNRTICLVVRNSYLVIPYKAQF